MLMVNWLGTTAIQRTMWRQQLRSGSGTGIRKRVLWFYFYDAVAFNYGELERKERMYLAR
jgi:hypothetical protein